MAAPRARRRTTGDRCRARVCRPRRDADPSCQPRRRGVTVTRRTRVSVARLERDRFDHVEGVSEPERPARGGVRRQPDGGRPARLTTTRAWPNALETHLPWMRGNRKARERALSPSGTAMAPTSASATTRDRRACRSAFGSGSGAGGGCRLCSRTSGWESIRSRQIRACTCSWSVSGKAGGEQIDTG